VLISRKQLAAVVARGLNVGDRVSISFKNGDRESVALYSHWGGLGFVQEAKDYVAQLRATLQSRNNAGVYPIDRLEPNTVMVDFIRHITEGEELIESDVYLGKDGTDGDNSDNGHHAIKLTIKEKAP
jgi:hypothetical protein